MTIPPPPKKKNPGSPPPLPPRRPNLFSAVRRTQPDIIFTSTSHDHFLLWIQAAIIHDIDIHLEMLYNGTLQNIMDNPLQRRIVKFRIRSKRNRLVSDSL